MAKENRDTPTKDTGDNSHSGKAEPTPFEKFDRLAKKIVRVPKHEADKREQKSRKAG